MAAHRLCPGARILTIGPLSGSSAPYHCTEPAHFGHATPCMQWSLLQLLQAIVCQPSSMHTAADTALGVHWVL